jgi:hypothetical protein
MAVDPHRDFGFAWRMREGTLQNEKVRGELRDRQDAPVDAQLDANVRGVT